jgi:hypothetical protein
MGTVDQHGKGNLQEGRGLRNPVDEPEGQIARVQLIGQADHGGRSSAADNAVQIAEYLIRVGNIK